ncbi:unnamed protein product, partial [Rotaria magnacalcarata]
MLQLQIDHNIPELLQENLQEQINSVRVNFSKLKEYHEHHIPTIRDSLFF